MGDKAKKILFAAIAVLVVIVIFQNTESVQTKILFVSISMPRILLLFATLAVGFVLGAMFGNRYFFGKKKS